MNSAIKVSVIITTYNRANYVVECVQSALDQTFKDLEVVVIDDGSTDDTQDVLEQYRELPNFHYYYQENQERAVARNNGIKQAHGEYLLILDSDDRLTPNAVEDLYGAVVRDQNVGASAGLIEYIDEDGKKIDFIDSFGNTIYSPFYKKRARPLWRKIFGSPRSLFWQVAPDLCKKIPEDAYLSLINGEHIMWGSMLIKKELAETVGGFDPSMVPAEDSDFEFRIAIKSRIAFIEKVTLQVRRHSSNTSAEKFSAIAIKLFEKHLDILEKSNDLPESLRQKAKAALLYHLGNRCYAMEDNREAIKYYLKSVKTAPRKAFNPQFLLQTVKTIVPLRLRNRFSLLNIDLKKHKS